MHRLLARQLKKHLQDEALREQLSDFLQSVDSAYSQADEDRKLLEHSIEMTSQELFDRNQDLKQRLAQQRSTQEKLSHTLHLMSSTLESSLESVVVIDAEDEPVVFNQNFLSLMGLTEPQLRRLRAADLYLRISSLMKDPRALYLQHQRVGNDNTASATHELYDGRVFECDATWDAEIGYLWSFRDITERYRQEEHILHQAHHDALTGLPNRLLLLDRIEHAVERAKRDDLKLAIFYLDLDNFKHINDSLGHGAGDQLLIHVAQQLTQALREGDTIARLGGDEFVVLAEDMETQTEVIYLAETLLNALKEPLIYQQHPLFSSTSIGIALYPNDGQEAGHLLKNADTALYQAKDEGRNRFHFFTDSLERLAQHRLAIETQLRGAVQQGNFEMHYQPEFRLSDGHLIGFEALLRWPTADGYTPPDTFIPIAESTGLIVPLGEWIIDYVCQQLARWRRAGHDNFYVAINLSAKQFRHQDIFQQVIECLKKYQLPHRMLAIEITESMVINDLDKACNMLRQFQQAGIKVCMDDFGTGYSSLNYLKQLPIDVLKIDRSFIDEISGSKQSRAIVSSIISLGQNLEQEVIAEGVETDAQLQVLTELGCDLVQGYLLGKPLPALIPKE